MTSYAHYYNIIAETIYNQNLNLFLFKLKVWLLYLKYKNHMFKEILKPIRTGHTVQKIKKLKSD